MKTANELTIAEVIKTDMFFNNMQNLLSILQSSRTKALYQYRGQVKAHPIDRLTNKGLFNASDMAVLYAQVMDKKCRLARSERDFVKDVGTEVFLTTMKKIIDDEKCDNNVVNNTQISNFDISETSEDEKCNNYGNNNE